MRKWLIRQDCPNGGTLSFVGDHAFHAHWMLSADPPNENPPAENPSQHKQANDERYWFRTGDDDDDVIVQFFDLRWQNAPPEPERARKLMANAVTEINQMIGERF